MKHTGTTALVLEAILFSSVFAGAKLPGQDIVGPIFAETPLINDRLRLFVSGYLVYSARASDEQTVVCEGRVLMKDRQLLSLDLDEIKARVGEGLNCLSRRVPDARIQLYRP